MTAKQNFSLFLLQKHTVQRRIHTRNSSEVGVARVGTVCPTMIRWNLKDVVSRAKYLTACSVVDAKNQRNSIHTCRDQRHTKLGA